MATIADSSVPASPPHVQLWQDGQPVPHKIVWVWVRRLRWCIPWQRFVMALSHKVPIVQLERPAPAGERLVVMYETGG